MLLYVGRSSFYVRNGTALAIEQRSLATGALEKRFPRSGHHFGGALVEHGDRVLYAHGPERQTSPSCPQPGGIFELKEDGEPEPLLYGAAPPLLLDGPMVYHRNEGPICCQSGACSGGGSSAQCSLL